MSDIINLIKSIMPHIKDHTSKRAYAIFCYGATIAAIFYLMTIGSYVFQKEIAKFSLLIAFIFTALTGVGIIISWLFDLKHKWDMRWVMIINEDGTNGAPANAIYAKKMNSIYRKMTRAEKKPLKEYIRKNKITDIYDPEIPMKNYRRIREEQDNKTP